MTATLLAYLMMALLMIPFAYGCWIIDQQRNR